VTGPFPGVTLLESADPYVLVRGSVATLHADADNLDAMATTLQDESLTVRRALAPDWEGAAAEGYRARRLELSDTLAAISEIHAIAAAALRAHAGTLTWAQDRAAVAVALWQIGTQRRAAAGLPALNRWTTPNPFEHDPGQGHRDLAEQVLQSAREQVTTSGNVAAGILADLDEGIPDGGWHPGDFGRGAWSWVTGIASVIHQWHPLRALIDPRGYHHDAHDTIDRALATWHELALDPFTTGKDLLDLDTLNEHPGQWWGAIAPDIALTVAGAGAAAWTARSAKAATYLRALEAGEELPGGGLYKPGSVWADPAARQRWFDELQAGPDSGANQVRRTIGGGERPWLQYQRRTAGPEEYRLGTVGKRIWVDSVQLDPDAVVAAEAKYVGSPGSSVYEGNAPKWLVDEAMEDFDSEMRRYKAVIEDESNPIARLRLYANTPKATEFLEARARTILGENIDLHVVIER